jgi:hypothetical protein
VFCFKRSLFGVLAGLATASLVIWIDLLISAAAHS